MTDRRGRPPGERALLALMACVAGVFPSVLLAASRSGDAGVRRERSAMHAVGGTGETFTTIASLLAWLPELCAGVTVATAAALLLPDLRRRSAAALALLALGNGGAHALKNVLARSLAPAAATVPSGHAVLALTSACALVIVAPSRWRRAALVLAGAVATVGCSGVVAAYWHVPGDVVASLALVAALVAAGRAWSDEPQPWAVERRDLSWCVIGSAWVIVTFVGWGSVINGRDARHLLAGTGSLVVLPLLASLVVAFAARPSPTSGATH